MKKIPTLFKRIYDDGGVYGCTREVTPGCEWVLEGKGEATEKVDGSAVARIGGVWYKRFDAKDGRKIPAGSIACSPRRDPITGHWPHWAIADMRNPSNRWLSAAIVNTPWIGEEDGTFELVGKHIQGNPYGLDAEFLERHGRIKIKDCPRTYDGIKEYLRTHEIEGIVWWLDGEPRCKVKRSDFGFEWPVKDEDGGSFKMSSKIKDETGNVFGKLTVKEFAGVNEKGDALWKCVCECGGEEIVASRNLRTGRTRSCGCLRSEIWEGAND